jgi:hypothetical protein
MPTLLDATVDGSGGSDGDGGGSDVGRGPTLLCAAGNGITTPGGGGGGEEFADRLCAEASSKSVRVCFMPKEDRFVCVAAGVAAAPGIWPLGCVTREYAGACLLDSNPGASEADKPDRACFLRTSSDAGAAATQLLTLKHTLMLVSFCSCSLHFLFGLTHHSF